MNRPLITDIQKYSIHDGEGIRTTVFFKGCPLSCIWCHNPETQSFSGQLLFQAERCTGCGSCIKGCSSKAISVIDKIAVTEEGHCIQCGACLDYCPQNIREISGTYYSPDELIYEIEKDKAFYEQSGGGITFSGGEVLAQDMDYLEEIMKRLYQKGYRINIDTCGHTPFANIKRILPYVNTFLYDIKIMDPVQHKKLTGVENSLILNNLRQLSREGAAIWIRIPVIGGVNDTIPHMEEIAGFLREESISLKQIHLLPYHNTGSSKYKRLNRAYKGEHFRTPGKKELEDFGEVFRESGFHEIMTGG